MKETIDILLMKFCFLGLGGIAVFAFFKATWPSVSRQIGEPIREAVRKRRVSIIIPIACVCGLISYASNKNNVQTNESAAVVQQIVTEATKNKEVQITHSQAERGEGTAFRPTASLGSVNPERCVATQSSSLALIEPWFRRGGRDTGHILTFDEGWVLPHGTNHLTHVELWGSGAVYPSEKNPTPLARLTDRLSLKPNVTSVFCGKTTNNTYRIEWHDGFRSRTSDETIDASIELFRNGDIIVTEDGETTVIPYEIPFEHNGFGQDETWVRANFDNADEILSIGYTNWAHRTVCSNAPNGLFCLNVAFDHDPEEIVRLSVGDKTVAVNAAGVYSFVLPKGERHGIEMSFVPEGTDFTYYDAYTDVSAPAPRQAVRRIAGIPNVYTEITASGSTSEVEVVVPNPFAKSGYITWIPFLSLSPDHEINPSFPIYFNAFVDLPLDEHPSIRWASNDGSISDTGEWIAYDGSASACEITVTATYKEVELIGHISIHQVVSETRIALAAPSVIVVEDPYTNSPGVVVMRTSNTVKMTVSWELAQSGRLRLESSGSMPTRVCFGNEADEITSFPYDIGSFGQHENGSLDFYLTSTNMNATGNVGNYRLRFIPDEGAEHESSADVRIVKIRVEADADWPSNKVRHVFGPKEEFSISIVSPAGGILNTDAGESIGERTVNANIDGLPLSVDINVIGPSDIRGEFVRPMTDQDWFSTNRDPLFRGVCGAGFIATWYLLPDCVSFKNIYVAEGFAPMSARSGCFLDTTLYPPNIYWHDDNAGANNPMPISGDNRVGGNNGHDKIGVQFGNPPTTPGSYTLSIPWRWSLDQFSCTNHIRYVNQVITTDGEGNTTIIKLNIQHTRNAFE